MKNTFFFLLIFTFSFTTISAQQDHFLYFQTEAHQAFYVKLDNKVFNSSSSGYLILPKLKEGNYKLIFGFPNGQSPEEVVNYTLEKDEGFILKNLPDNGWGLYDLQSSRVIMPGERLAGSGIKNEEVKTDVFSEMLATVVNDSTIKQKEIVAKEEEKLPSKNNIIGSVEPVKEILQKDSTAEKALYSVITRNLQLKNIDGIDMVYTDEYKNERDTIKIFMPGKSDKETGEADSGKPGGDKRTDSETGTIKLDTRPDTTKNIQEQPAVNLSSAKEQTNDNSVVVGDTAKNIQEQPPVNQSSAKDQTNDTSVMVGDTAKNIQEQPTVNQSSAKEQTNDTPIVDSAKDIKKEQLSDTSITSPDTRKSTAGEDKIDFLPPKSGMVNSNCRQYATSEDFLKLRKRMAAENNEDKMIATAKKVFRAKCFTVKDIKNLSALFLNDAGKYNFFDAAYPYVSDSDLFYILKSQLSDEYYLKRFEAMIHH